MARHTLLRGVVASAIAAVLAFVAAPAFAQGQGSIRGLVVDEAGKPQPGVELVLEFQGDLVIKISTKTDARGEFVRTGLRPGGWKITATQGALVGVLNIRVLIGEMTRIENVVLKGGKAAVAAALSNKEIEERNKKTAAIKADYEAAMAAIETNPDEAITKLTAIVTEFPDCAICHSKIGDAQNKKGDQAKAEAAYLKAIETDAKLPDPYSALAILYNSQKKFAEAGKMGEKANELLGANATGGDPAALFNQGIIYWNQGNKAEEAKAQFEKAIKVDPKMAEAHYWLGMANVNLNHLPEAVKSFEEYLKLAPTGQYAEMSQTMLKAIKK